MTATRYAHDCASCIFLGHHEEYDLYLHPQVNAGQPETLIARYGSAGEYMSAPPHLNPGLPPLAEAMRLAVAAGLTPPRWGDNIGGQVRSAAHNLQPCTKQVWPENIRCCMEAGHSGACVPQFHAPPSVSVAGGGDGGPDSGGKAVIPDAGGGGTITLTGGTGTYSTALGAVLRAADAAHGASERRGATDMAGWARVFSALAAKDLDWTTEQIDAEVGWHLRAWFQAHYSKKIDAARRAAGEVSIP